MKLQIHTGSTAGNTRRSSIYIITALNYTKYSYQDVSLNAVGVFLYREILCYPTPINFNYWYGIGLLLVFLLVNQVLTGIQVGSYYIVSIDVALSSVDYLMREITYGWSFRYLHSNGAY